MNTSEKIVLIVEDDYSSALLIREILSDTNYKTKHINDGPEAIDFVKNSKTDLVLMDLKLPTMSGYQATQEIRKFNKKIPIIAQTANAILGDQQKAFDAGCNDYISKPIDANLLIGMIKKYLSNN